MAIEQKQNPADSTAQNGREKPEQTDRDGLLCWHRVPSQEKREPSLSHAYPTDANRQNHCQRHQRNDAKPDPEGQVYSKASGDPRHSNRPAHLHDKAPAKGLSHEVGSQLIRQEPRDKLPGCMWLWKEADESIQRANAQPNQKECGQQDRGCHSQSGQKREREFLRKQRCPGQHPEGR